MKIAVLAVLVVVALAGCSTQRFNVGGKVDDTSIASETKMHSFFISGIGQTKTVDAAAICGSANNVISVQAKQSFVNGLLGVVTFGIYTPREYSVYCKK